VALDEAESTKLLEVGAKRPSLHTSHASDFVRSSPLVGKCTEDTELSVRLSEFGTEQQLGFGCHLPVLRYTLEDAP